MQAAISAALKLLATAKQSRTDHSPPDGEYLIKGITQWVKGWKKRMAGKQ